MFEAAFESLYNFSAPEWYRDAKFGIWSHWGPQSVPMMGDWYAKKMYMQGTPAYEFHRRTYGHPSVFGYKDICALWRAEKFDPEGLMKLYKASGAGFFCAQAMHHDHFFNYASDINPMNSALVGPRKDICALWQQAAKNQGLPFGLSEHLAVSFSWWNVNKGSDKYGEYAGVPYDGNDPKWRYFYHDNYCHVSDDPNMFVPRCTTNTGFHRYWRRVMSELIERFEPDFLYSDSSLPFGRHWADKTKQTSHLDDQAYRVGLETVAQLYNASIRKYGENRALYMQKNRGAEIYKIGVLDMERSVLTQAAKDPWNTDTCLGDWFYDKTVSYKQPDLLIEMLVDIVSKNGSLMLNVPQRPDGTIDEEEIYILNELGAWLKLNGEGIYSTRPYTVCGEGDTQAGEGEGKTNWTQNDVRYTYKAGKVYAFLMNPKPDSTVTLRAFNEKRINRVIMPNAGEIEFSAADNALNIKLPERLNSKYVNMLIIEGENL